MVGGMTWLSYPIWSIKTPFVLGVWRMGIMKFKISIKFNNDKYYSKFRGEDRIVDEVDFDDNIRVLNRMLASGEITSYMVTLDSDESLECTCFTCDPECEVISMGDHLRNTLERSTPCIN